MASSLPIEIWWLILEHTLILHPFFSTDPVADFTENRYDAAIDDWLNTRWGEEFRRQRLVLRQVCHSWKTFVDRPEIKLRFGCMNDVLTYRLSIAELMQARRIEALTYDYPEATIDSRILKALEDGDVVFNAEIITDVIAPMTQLLLEHPSAFPHLKSLQLYIAVETQWDPDGFAKISKDFPSMVFLSLTVEFVPFSSGDILRLQSLTTLVITAPYSHIAGLSFDQWSLPSLRHLELGVFHNSATLQSFLGALSHLGRGLKVLDVEVDEVDEDTDDTMPHLWRDCPRLESLRFPMSLLIAHPPTQNRHPLRYLVNSELDFRGSSWCTAIGWLHTDFTSALISFCNALPSLLVVRDSHDWTSVLFRDLENNVEAATNFRTSLDKECSRQMVETAVQIKSLNMAVRFEDVNEKIWEEI